jgi:hypothetical protein
MLARASKQGPGTLTACLILCDRQSNCDIYTSSEQDVQANSSSIYSWAHAQGFIVPPGKAG